MYVPGEPRTLHRSSGPLLYSRGPEGGYRLVVDVDREITRYYRSLIPKWIVTQPQAYPPHISVVRKEVPGVLDAWGRHEGEEVEFFYAHDVRHGEIYWWLDAFCTRLEEVRVELGLPVSSPYTRPPDGFSKCFHITIGNTKQKHPALGKPVGAGQ